MLPLDHGNALLNHVAAASVQYLLKELCIVIQFICHHKLWLEILPYFMMLLCFNTFSQNNRFSKIVVEFSRVTPELSQIVYFDVTRLVELLLCDLEVLLFLVKINKVIVQYL